MYLQGKNGLDRHEEGGHVEGFEEDLRGMLSVGVRI